MKSVHHILLKRTRRKAHDNIWKHCSSYTETMIWLETVEKISKIPVQRNRLTFTTKYIVSSYSYINNEGE